MTTQIFLVKCLPCARHVAPKCPASPHHVLPRQPNGALRHLVGKPSSCQAADEACTKSYQRSLPGCRGMPSKRAPFFFFKSNLNLRGRLPKPPPESFGELHLDVILSSNKFLFNLKSNQNTMQVVFNIICWIWKKIPTRKVSAMRVNDLLSVTDDTSQSLRKKIFLI